MNFVVDTNILFSALYNLKSNAGDLLILALHNRVKLIAPMTVNFELVRNLTQKLNFTQDEIERIFEALPVEWVETDVIKSSVMAAEKYITHKNDIPIVACALAFKSDIISGDKHFHPLQKPGIRVWHLKEFLDQYKI